MSIGTLTKTATETYLAYKFIRLMQKDFKDWHAYQLGIIDDKGNLLKRPKTDEEKQAYGPMTAAVRSLKKNLARIPGAQTWVTFNSMLSAMQSRVGLTEADIEIIQENMKLIFEEDGAMVAGDAKGDPDKIAAGENSGAIVNKGPQVLGKTKKAKTTSSK